MIWDFIIICAILLTLIAFPIDIAFYSEPHHEPEKHHEPEHHSNPEEPVLHRAQLSHDDEAVSDDEVVALGWHKMSRDRYFWFMSSFICEIFFVLDILLDFRTGYVDEETEEVKTFNSRPK